MEYAYVLLSEQQGPYLRKRLQAYLNSASAVPTSFADHAYYVEAGPKPPSRMPKSAADSWNGTSRNKLERH